MSRPLQQFGYRESRYERPNQKWVCGWAADGDPCAAGPDGRGRCPAASEAQCAPRQIDDRWHCTRPELFGGRCGPGPRPDGTCGRPEPAHPVCRPRLSARARRGRFTLICLLAGIGAMCLLLGGPWRSRFINAGPLTSAHSVMDVGLTGRASCAACHTPAGGVLDVLQPVTDQACLECHVAEAHHPRSLATPTHVVQLRDRLGSLEMASGCVDCHAEHRGRDEQIRLVADHACTRCHADLAPWRRPGPATRRPSAFPAVEPPVDAAVADGIGSFADDHPEFRLFDQPRVDATALRFDHHGHLDLDRMQAALTRLVANAAQRGVPEPALAVRRNTDGTLTLTCASCHEPDATGRAMKPILFEQHCVACHDLGAIEVGGERRQVPHGGEAMSFVRSVAVEHVAAERASRRAETPPTPTPEAQSPETAPRRPGRPGRPGASEPEPTPARPGRPGRPEAATTQTPPSRPGRPGRPSGAGDAAASEGTPLEADVRQQTERLGRRLHLKSCVKCHDPAGTIAVADPAIPSRWLDAAIFSHAAHQFMACTDCHGQAVAARPDMPEDVPDALRWTGRTKEIMLPRIDDCRACHAPRARAPHGAVRHDCALCHEYHVPSLSGVVATMP